MFEIVNTQTKSEKFVFTTDTNCLHHWLFIYSHCYGFITLIYGHIFVVRNKRVLSVLTSDNLQCIVMHTYLFQFLFFTTYIYSFQRRCVIHIHYPPLTVQCAYFLSFLYWKETWKIKKEFKMKSRLFSILTFPFFSFGEKIVTINIENGWMA